jgi:hypothetical protein
MENKELFLLLGGNGYISWLDCRKKVAQHLGQSLTDHLGSLDSEERKVRIFTFPGMQEVTKAEVALYVSDSDG